MKLTPQR